MVTKKVGRPATAVDETTIGGKIRAGRQRKKLSVAEASAAVGVSASTWYEYERNDRIPPVDTLRAICDLIGRSPAGLLKGVDFS